MPELKDMKRTPEEMKEEMVEERMGMDVPEYPYGLCLRLDDEVVKKLEKDFAAGSEVKLMAVATVKSVTTHEEETQEGGGVKSDVVLQITAMAVEDAGGASASDKAKRMYPSMSEEA